MRVGFGNGWFRGICLGREGQMTVELAVVLPVTVAVALVVWNLMGFVCACAAFDRLALDAVCSQGVSPAGAGDVAATEAVREDIVQSLGRLDTCEVEVSSSRANSDAEGSTFLVSPLLTRYVCTLSYKPWPTSLRLPGVTLAAPVRLTHVRELVVDRYRSGVVS